MKCGEANKEDLQWKFYSISKLVYLCILTFPKNGPASSERKWEYNVH